MTRRILRNLDLSGRVLDASLEPDGHARESLVEGCTFDANTRFLGDIRGSDFVNNTGPADWSGADTYACYWRGNTLTGAKFPALLGWMHHEPVAEIVRQNLARLTQTRLRDIATAFREWVALNYADKEWWAEAWEYRLKTVTGATPARYLSVLRTLLSDHYLLLRRADWLEKSFADNVLPVSSTGTPPPTTLVWVDGSTLVLDRDNLPVLPDRSRYSLARWLESQSPTGEKLFVWSLRPLAISKAPMDMSGNYVEDFWIRYRQEQY